MYGKIIDGKLVTAPNPITIGKYRVHNPRSEHYEAEGYLEVIEIEYPSETDKYYEKQYVEREGKIYGEWVETEAPEATEPTTTLEQRTTALEKIVDGLNETLDMILEGVTE